MSGWSTKGKYVKLTDIVVYVYGPNEERAAIVVRVDSVESQIATLRVLDPNDATRDMTVPHVLRNRPTDDPPIPGKWRWPS